MIRASALILATLLHATAADEHLGYLGRWVDVVATAYSPHDAIDSEYRSTKGRDLYMTSGRVSDVRRVPFNVAAPVPGRAPAHLTIPLRTRVIVPRGYGYLDHSSRSRVFTVDDTGGRVTTRTRETRTMHIDLRVKTEAEALSYGRRTIRIFIISGPAPMLGPVHVPEQQRPVAAPVSSAPTVADPRPDAYQWRETVLTIGLIGLLLSVSYLFARFRR